MHSSPGPREGRFSEYQSSPEGKLSQGKACRRVGRVVLPCLLHSVWRLSKTHKPTSHQTLTAAWKVLHEGRPKIKVLGPKHSLSQRWQSLVLLSRLEGGVSPLNCWPPCYQGDFLEVVIGCQALSLDMAGVRRALGEEPCSSSLCGVPCRPREAGPGAKAAVQMSKGSGPTLTLES